MRAVRALLVGTATVAAFVAAASAASGQDAGGRTPHGFFATLAVTDDVQRFIGEWERPGAHVDLHVATHVARGAGVTPFVIFENCKADARGACDVAAEFTLTAPDGKVMGPARTPIWNLAPLGPDIFMRARAAPTFKLADAAPRGAYTFTVRVTDRVSGASLTLTRPITYG